jgi:hypothetical protein
VRVAIKEIFGAEGGPPASGFRFGTRFFDEFSVISR